MKAFFVEILKSMKEAILAIIKELIKMWKS